ncbi:LVIVD repeat-containing protein [Roseateles sp. PN1]|uniref:LVIVD repeat-containing protein n=1 Tax=Roseateles sp. PN1 TaxID=3137372 RepID=UPI003139C8BB
MKLALTALLIATGLNQLAAAQTITPPAPGAARLPVKEDREEPKAIAGQPARPDAASFGLDPVTGVYKHPAETPSIGGTHPFKGSLDHLDLNQYQLNTKVEGQHPEMLGSPYHSWQTTVDMNGHRYMVVHEKSFYKVFDITDPRKVELIANKKWGWGSSEHPFGPLTIQYNEKLKKNIAVQCYEVTRFGILSNKYDPADQAKVDVIRKQPLLRGFRVFEVDSPDPAQWKKISELPLDAYSSPDKYPQQGSGCGDVPVYWGGKYLFVSGAPDDTFANQEYANFLYNQAQMAFDLSDPHNPKRLSTWWVPGSRLGEEEEYKKNPRVGKKTSWMGARMPLFIPKDPEKGGKYGYAAMGGMGLHVIDVSDPAKMKRVGKLDMPVSQAGTEGDNIDVTKVEKTGVIYYSGYPLNEDCYEPYKDIYAVDVKDPTQPKVLATLPRPTPPKGAPFTDYCQRRGSFGPKRSGYWHQPGTPSDKYLIYAFYNAGAQIFDVSNPAKPKIAGYFVPPTVDPKVNQHFGDQTHGVFIEWDRNIIWVFTNHGGYAVSSSLLGAPKFDLKK